MKYVLPVFRMHARAPVNVHLMTAKDDKGPPGRGWTTSR